jgi:hypothetical protein
VTAKTDAEKLAQAEAMMAAAAAQAKAARLPSAQAAVTLLTSEAALAFLSDLKAAVASSVDDLPRPVGTPGAEGTKQMLQRIAAAFEGGLTASQNRVSTLSPAPAPAVAPDADS